MIYSCKKTSTLLSISKEKPLTFSEKVGVRTHILLCTKCRQFEKNLATLSKICKAEKERSINE